MLKGHIRSEDLFRHFDVEGPHWVRGACHEEPGQWAGRCPTPSRHEHSCRLQTLDRFQTDAQSGGFAGFQNRGLLIAPGTHRLWHMWVVIMAGATSLFGVWPPSRRTTLEAAGSASPVG
mmetsp:Transcript_7130/g.12606  ORF Transcript_7130/g.12606 Transcript_7130/m.12606 type:complete len:119 (-) Transcript_7130:114-470(-)